MHWENIGNYFLDNFILLFLLAVVAVVLSQPHQARGVNKKWLWAGFGASLLMSLQSYFMDFCAGDPSMHIYHVILAFVGFLLRPLVVAMAVMSIENSRKVRLLLSIPLFVNLAVFQTCFYSDIAFRFDESDMLVRGPLSMTVFLVSLFYVIALFVLIFRRYQYARHKDTPMLVVLACGILGASILDLFDFYFYTVRSHVVAPLTIIFLYFLLRNQDLDRDPLTGLLSRQSYYDDVKRLSSISSGVLGIDLNGLKAINDKEGHASGDHALKVVADILIEGKGDDAYAYRFGGDEFVIVFTRMSKEEMIAVSEKIQKAVKDAGYQVSVGFAYQEKDETLGQLLKEADRILYENKRAYYESAKAMEEQKEA